MCGCCWYLLSFLSTRDAFEWTLGFFSMSFSLYCVGIQVSTNLQGIILMTTTVQCEELHLLNCVFSVMALIKLFS